MSQASALVCFALLALLNTTDALARRSIRIDLPGADNFAVSGEKWNSEDRFPYYNVNTSASNPELAIPMAFQIGDELIGGAKFLAGGFPYSSRTSTASIANTVWDMSYSQCCVNVLGGSRDAPAGSDPRQYFRFVLFDDAIVDARYSSGFLDIQADTPEGTFVQDGDELPALRFTWYNAAGQAVGQMLFLGVAQPDGPDKYLLERPADCNPQLTASYGLCFVGNSSYLDQNFNAWWYMGPATPPGSLEYAGVPRFRSWVLEFNYSDAITNTLSFYFFLRSGPTPAGWQNWPVNTFIPGQDLAFCFQDGVLKSAHTDTANAIASCQVPPNDDRAKAEEVLPGPSAGTLARATPDGDSECTSFEDVWYSFRSPGRGVLQADSCGTHDQPAVDAGVDTVLSLFTGDGALEWTCTDNNAFAIIGSQRCEALDTGLKRDAVVYANVEPDETTLIRVAKRAESPPGPFQLYINFEPADSDGDGLADDAYGFRDNCPNVPNSGQENQDGDSRGDACDNCTLVANDAQVDANGDRIGNLCDADLNNDNLTNTLDLNLYRLAHRSVQGGPTYRADADFNSDGAINTLDLNILRGLYRRPPGPSGVPAL